MINRLAVASAAVIPSISWAVHAHHLRRQLRAARRDPLTGLWTRPGFTARAGRLLTRGDVVVVLVDGDDFKAVNDSWGHAVGDSALRAAATRLARWATTLGGVAGRLGGDEFAAAIPTPPGEVAALVAGLSTRLRIDLGTNTSGCPMEHMTCSIGAVIAPRGTDLSDALAGADAAMYQAKAHGGAVIGSVTGTMPRRASRHGINVTASLEDPMPRQSRAAEGWQRLPIDTGAASPQVVTLVASMVAVVAALAAWPVQATLALPLGASALVLYTGSVVLDRRAGAVEMEALHAELEGLHHDRDELLGLVEDLRAEASARDAELAEALAEVDRLRGEMTDREDGSIQLYGQARELIDLTACLRSSLDAARAEAARWRADAETYRMALVQLAGIAGELRPDIADRRGAYSAEGDPVAALLDAVDEATRAVES